MANAMANEGVGGRYCTASNTSGSGKGNHGQQQLISFGSSQFNDFEDACANTRRTKRSAREHALVERKRRQKLSQLFLSLASHIPGLQKGEKQARIVGETTSYIRELKQRVLLLEQQALKRRTQDQTMDSAQSCHIFTDEGSFCSSDGNSNNISSMNGASDIEVQLSDENDDILIAVHCQKDDDVLPKLLLEMRKLHLTPSNINVMPFGNYMDVTIIAQKQEHAISMATEDMQNLLRSALQ
uniref:BHLH domain-containing protein n=1 Tax=Opuntia streptacantha TaxID=393608 RepID=A0A7C8YZT3_OPUST